MNDELLWAMLPEGLEPYFEIENFKKTDMKFQIVLAEKNEVPSPLPKQYQGKKIVNTVLKNIVIDDFPVRGRKGELIIKRRYWEFEDVSKLLKRHIPLRAKGTKLQKEFAYFLKELRRDGANSTEPDCEEE